MIVIDTDIVIDHLRGHQPSISFFESILHTDDVFFSAITEAELVAGKACADENKKELLLHFLHRWIIIPVSHEIAVLAGDLAREYSLTLPDALIAATARIHKAELLTRNVKDFKDIPGLTVRAPY